MAPAAHSCGPGRKNGAGRTKEWSGRGGQNGITRRTVRPKRQLSTKPGQPHGSGPMRFVRSDWVPGVRSAFEKFDGYVPRPEEASWMAGGKRIVADRIEWITMPDPATVAAALQTGEIDWWEIAIPDLVPLLRKNRNISVDIQDRLGNVGILGANTVFPPFNDARARRAILMAMST